MSSYAEKMMKLSGVEPEIHKEIGRDIDNEGNLSSWYIEKYYPEFTKEKQLNLIQLIGLKIDYMCYFDNDAKEWHICAEQRCNPVYWNYWNYLCVNEDFAEALAELIYKLIKDKVLNKDEVKGVLE